MRFVTFQYAGEEMAGIVSFDGLQVVPFANIPGVNRFRKLVDLIIGATDADFAVLDDYQEAGEGIDLKDILLLAPFPHPHRPLLCLGKNFHQHIQEVAAVTGGADLPPLPIYFAKMTAQATGDRGEIYYRPDLDVYLDYEVELAVVIGKTGIDISVEDAYDYVFGYTIVNDISARKLQKDHGQWFRGKSLDGNCPMGPWIVHKSAVPQPSALALRSYVNGELRQNGNTADMIFDIPAIISNLSSGMTLFPGDIISTGTPAGVGMGFQPPKYLKPGDEVTCEIEGIGSLRNFVVQYNV